MGVTPFPPHLDQVFLGNGQSLPMQSISSVSFPSPYNPNIQLLLKDRLQVPSITKDLISVQKFSLDNNAYLQFHPSHFLMKSQANDELLLKGPVAPGWLYPLSKPSTNHTFSNVSFPFINTTDVSHTTGLNSVLHNRLGHPKLDTLNCVLKLCNIPTISSNKKDFGIACCMEKHTEFLHNFPLLLTLPLYNLFFCDLWGPAPMDSSMGYKYYLSFVYAFSRYTWIYFIKSKFDTLNTFKQFKSMVELQLNTKIKSIQSEWGGGVNFAPSHNISLI